MHTVNYKAAHRFEEFVTIFKKNFACRTNQNEKKKTALIAEPLCRAAIASNADRKTQ